MLADDICWLSLPVSGIFAIARITLLTKLAAVRGVRLSDRTTVSLIAHPVSSSRLSEAN